MLLVNKCCVESGSRLGMVIAYFDNPSAWCRQSEPFANMPGGIKTGVKGLGRRLHSRMQDGTSRSVLGTAARARMPALSGESLLRQWQAVMGNP